MPNKHSKAGHIPIRTCVVCKKRVDRSLLLGFLELTSSLVFDIHNILLNRKMYVCDRVECKSGLDAWYRRFGKRRKNHTVMGEANVTLR